MNLKSALKAISEPGEGMPVEALRWLLDNWSVSSGALTQILARCARDPAAASDEDFIAGYFGLHLLAEKRETRAFPLFLALARNPEGIPEMFGMALILTMSKMMVSLFDGKLAPLRELIESPQADKDVRVSAFETLAFATAHEQVPRDEAHALLAEFADKALDDKCWFGWAACIAILGFADLRPQVEAAFADGRIDPEDLELEDLAPVFELAREDATGKAALDRDAIHPIADAIDHLEKIDAILEALDDGEDDPDGADFNAGEPGTPLINPNREVGRNDPCPCGSGMKYKKCCLAA